MTWAISSAGRAPALQAGCRQFDPVIAHHYRYSKFVIRSSSHEFENKEAQRDASSNIEPRTSNLEYGPVV